jgi:hypothetical protein
MAEIEIEQLTQLDNAFKITPTGNNEVLFAWLELCIRNKYKKAYERLDSFLGEVGRRKFTLPLYEALVSSNQKSLATSLFSKYKTKYHAVTAQSVAEVLE